MSPRDDEFFQIVEGKSKAIIENMDKLTETKIKNVRVSNEDKHNET